MKRFVAFSIMDASRPSGGMDDCCGLFDRIDDAKAAALREHKDTFGRYARAEIAEVWDTETDEVHWSALWEGVGTAGEVIPREDRP